MLTFKLATTERQIEQAIGGEIARRAYNSVYNPFSRLQDQVTTFIETSITNSPEADDLIRGFMRTEFGLVDPATNVANIIKAIISAAKVKPANFRYVGKPELAGKITIEVLRDDLREVLGLSDASFTSEGKFAGEVEWLRWLLLGGTSVVLAGFHVHHSPVNTQYSRTGGDALMFPGGNYSVTGSGFVPPQFAGTAGDNWLTRALEKINLYLEPLVEAEFRRAFS